MAHASQNDRILAHLRTGARLTQFEAIERHGILRLAARIGDLKDEGHNIKSEMIDVFNRFDEKCRVASYSLIRGKA